MSEQLHFGEGEERTWTVGRLNTAVARALNHAFPDEVWVRGEVQSLSRSKRGHTYFDLVESDGRATRRLKVVLLAQEWQHILHQMADEPDVAIVDGADLRIRGRITHYAPTGSTQLGMTGIDAFHTVGAIAAKRDRLMRTLRSEGVTEVNRRVEMPAVPLVVGLVTAVDSAAYNDVLRELADSGLGFRVAVCDARMQGLDGPASVVRAIRSLDRRGVDVVVVARGGGSATDLAAFDDERLARAIARTSVPVVTGIGHEVDVSVADEVAHTRCKTPTACASFLVERVRAWQQGTEAAWSQIVACSERALARHEEGLDQRRRRLARATTGGLRSEHRRLAELSARLSAPRLTGLIDRQADRIDERAGRLDRSARTHLARHQARLDALADRARLLDPALTLARGYSITVGPDGRAVRSVSEVPAGTTLVTRLADGTATSTVTHTEPVEEPE